MNIQMSRISKNRWGNDEPEIKSPSLDLLSRKDLQILRLQQQVLHQRHKADKAIEMLENYKEARRKQQEANSHLKFDYRKLMFAEQQIKKLQKRNNELQMNLKNYLCILKNKMKLSNQ